MFNMRYIFWLVLLTPTLLFAQSKPKATVKKKAPAAVVPAPVPPPLDGYEIEGEITGYANGTSVSIMNGNTGASEGETTLQNNKFVLKGKVQTPDFKVIMINKLQPYITLFLDNSRVKIQAAYGAIDRAVVTGSPSNGDFYQLNGLLGPYQSVFNQNAAYDSAAEFNVKRILEEFVKQHPNSYITPLAVIRYLQLGDDSNMPEQLFNLMAPEIKSTPLSAYVTQQINDGKKIPVGQVLPDFTQADTLGNPVKLSSLRGKFVLVDFWASWCHPCREENPNVVANYNKYKSKNFTVLGVSLDKDKPKWIDAIHADGLSWNHVSDLQGWGNAVAQQFQIFSIPQNILLDPEGRVVGKNLRGGALDRKLAKLLR